MVKYILYNITLSIIIFSCESSEISVKNESNHEETIYLIDSFPDEEIIMDEQYYAFNDSIDSLTKIEVLKIFYFVDSSIKSVSRLKNSKVIN